MSTHISIFEPFTNKPAHHEDTLTRAFLIVLKAVPVAHAAWLHLVSAGHRRNGGTGDFGLLHELPPPSIDTQVGSLYEPVERVVSLLQTDQHYTPVDDICESSRGQCLDGVICYPPKLAIVLENKLRVAAVRDDQLDLNLGEADPERPQLDPKLACVTWESIINAWANLFEADALGPAERVLVDDFLDLVEHRFNDLWPSSRVRLCKGNRPRLARRCRSLLVDLVGVDQVHEHRGWGTYVAVTKGGPATKVGFFPNDRGTELLLELAMGDTMNQARSLYGRFEYGSVERILHATGWEAHPNLHAMHVTKGLFYSRVTLDPQRYFELWREHHGWIRQWHRKQFKEVFSLLVEHQLAQPEDEVQFDADFTNTDRKTLNLCPGFIIRRRFSFDEAASLDDGGKLGETVWQEMRLAAEEFKLQLPRRVKQS